MRQRTVEDRHAQGPDGFVFEDPSVADVACGTDETAQAPPSGAKAA